MLGNLGFWEILLILVVVALLFGGKKLPQLGKGLGEGISNFKNALTGKSDNQPDQPNTHNEKDN